MNLLTSDNGQLITTLVCYIYHYVITRVHYELMVMISYPEVWSQMDWPTHILSCRNVPTQRKGGLARHVKKASHFILFQTSVL